MMDPGSESASEMELEAVEISVELKVEDDPSKLSISPEVSTYFGSASDENGGTAAAVQQAHLELEVEEELRHSVEYLTLTKSTVEDEDANQTDPISKLVAARSQSAIEKRNTRKAAWIDEAREETLHRKQGQCQDSKATFPELVWGKVLGHVEDAKDKQTLMNMNLLWRDLMKKERAKFLFGEVFSELHLKGYLTRHDILSCREVCQSWKKLIENHLQTWLDFRTRSGLTGLTVRANSTWEWEFLTMNFGKDLKQRSPVEFLEWSRSTYTPDGNPFISRKLRLDSRFFAIFGRNQSYWNGMDRLLHAWGSQVWQMDLILEMDTNSFEVYDMIRKYLKLMPNVRILGLVGHANLLDEVEYPHPKQRAFNERLKQHMRENPLPEMTNLNTIVAQVIPPLIMQEMMTKYGSTMDTVFNSGVTPSPYSYTGDTPNIPNLKRFYLFSENFPLQESRFTWSWPSLREVALVYMNIESMAIPTLFRALSGLQGLRKLLVSMGETEGPMVKLDGPTMKTLSLELPHLEDFSLGVCRMNLKTIDFILAMSSLKVLHVTYVKRVSSVHEEKKVEGCEFATGFSKSTSTPGSTSADPKSTSGEVIQFGDYTNRLYESNIWEVFPELRKVTIVIVKAYRKQGDDFDDLGKPDQVKQRIYTREGLKRYSSQEGNDDGSVSMAVNLTY